MNTINQTGITEDILAQIKTYGAMSAGIASVADLKEKLKLAAKKITKMRQKSAGALKQTIEKELSELGIAKVKFEARVEQDEFGVDGQDKVTFFISPQQF